MRQKPNIVMILIDDMGWMDLGCQGSSFYETPHIDQLARRGMRFTNAYAACPVCSPTRVSMLTGKYPANVGVTDWIDFSKRLHPARGRLIDAPYIDHIPESEYTLPTALSDGGYQTWHVGKWHCGGEGSLPEQRGFDVNVGGNEWGCPAGGGYFAPWNLPNLKGDDVEPGTYLDDYLTDRAIDLIAQRDADRPFFLNMWYYLVHTPIQAKQELIEKYQAKARALGLDQQTVLVEGEMHPTEHKKDIPVVRRVIQSDPVYAAMVEILDQNIGRLMEAIEQTGQADNTLIVFTSDNGGLATSEGSPTSNLPLAEGKGWMYEGGTREPLLISWPDVIAPGSVCHTPVTTPDFYPTFLEAAELEPRDEQACDGVSLMPLLRGEPLDHDRPLFWHYPHYGNQGGTPGSSIRRGEWKLIQFFQTGRLELYNLADDPGEKNDLAPSQPDRAKAMHHDLQAWRVKMNALIPAINPAWIPSAHPAANPLV